MKSWRKINPPVSGVLAIAATYIYFLLYAQFGFVSYLKLFFAEPVFTEKSMGLMGLGGLLFSFATAVLLRRHTPRSLLMVAFAGSAATALLTLTHASLGVLYTSAFFIGGFTGMATVTLASGLKRWINGGHFGLLVGVGTGLAYLICNIPPVFDATPMAQTVFSALVCLVGLSAVMFSRDTSGCVENPNPQRPTFEFQGIGFVAIVVMFLSLVWLDSTAFATIQLTEHLRAHTWGTPNMKMMLGFFHAFAAVGAGWMIDRRHLKSLLVGTFALFVVAFTMLQSNTQLSWLAGPLYAIGISIYSTALVAFPSLHPDAAGLVPARWRAAILYAVAGWIGSGLGVGLAQHLHSIPNQLLLASGLLIGYGLLFPFRRERFVQVGRYAGLLLAVAGGGLYFTFVPEASVPIADAPSIDLGREVYKQEGCINCHSQYLRPRSEDVVWWGPYRDIDRTEKPPMVGNRRQGPDLMNVGLRRSDVWHRQHLIQPRSLSPGSKMPSYAYLFGQGDQRGESLVLYLSSLGRTAAVARVETIQSWTPDVDHAEISVVKGQEDFERFCSPCHGISGQGNGPLSPLVFRPAMNLTKGPFMYVPAGLNDLEKSIALSRVVKFGLIGLHMPGHEYFSDQDIMDIVAYVQKLAASGPEL